MTQSLTLSEIEDQTLNYVLGMPPDAKASYFSGMIKTFYTHVKAGSNEWKQLMDAYLASWYAEKIYRSNRFFNESFTAIYTETGLLRDIILDIYFSDDDLIVH